MSYNSEMPSDSKMPGDSKMTSAPIKAKLKFLANLDEPLVYIPSKGGGDTTDHVGNFVMQEVDVRDARSELPSSSLDAEGFCLVSQKTTVDDFYDDDTILDDVNPLDPTGAKPGSETKVQMLAARYAAGVPLWHDSDCYDHGPAGAALFDDDEGGILVEVAQVGK